MLVFLVYHLSTVMAFSLWIFLTLLSFLCLIQPPVFYHGIEDFINAELVDMLRGTYVIQFLPLLFTTESSFEQMNQPTTLDYYYPSLTIALPLAQIKLNCFLSQTFPLI